MVEQASLRVLLEILRNLSYHQRSINSFLRGPMTIIISSHIKAIINVICGVPQSSSQKMAVGSSDLS